MKVKLTSEYLKKIKVTSDGIYDVEEARAKELVEAGHATYVDEQGEQLKELKEVKKKKTKVMKPAKKRTYKTKVKK